MKNGGTETFVYNTGGLRTSMTDALGNTTTFTYDSHDQLASMTDPNGHTTGYQYDLTGHLLQVTHPDSTTITYTYDAYGNRLTMTNELGHTWTWTYDEFNRKLTVTDPLSRTTTWHYGLPGEPAGCSSCHWADDPTEITLPSGKITTFNYDLIWQKISETVGYGSGIKGDRHHLLLGNQREEIFSSHFQRRKAPSRNFLVQRVYAGFAALPPFPNLCHNLSHERAARSRRSRPALRAAPPIRCRRFSSIASLASIR